MRRMSRTFRLQVENLECRTQPGGLLPFNEFSMAGYNLFDRDPLTDQVEAPAHLPAISRGADATALGLELGGVQQIEVVAPAARGPCPQACLGLGGVQQIEVVHAPAQQAVAVPTQTESHDLLLAAGVAATPKAGNTLTPVNSVVNAQAQRVELATVQAAAVQATNTLQISNHYVNGGPRLNSGTALFTSFNGVAGNEVGRGVAVDDAGVSYYGGWSQASGTQDMLIWSVSADGSAKLWEVTIDSGADEEANAVAVTPDGSTLYVAGWTNANDGTRDAVVLMLDATTGDQLNQVSLTIEGAVDETATDLRLSADGSTVCLSGMAGNGAGANAAMVACLSAADLSPVYGMAFTLDVPGLTTMDAAGIALNSSNEAYLAGGLTAANGQQAYFAKIGADGTFGFAGAYDLVGARHNSIDVLEDGTGTYFFPAGQFLAGIPNQTIWAGVTKFQDNLDGTFTNVWNNNIPLMSYVGAHTVANSARVNVDGFIFLMNEVWGVNENRDTGDNDANIIKARADGGGFADNYHYGTQEAQALSNDKGFGIALNRNLDPNTVWGTGKVNSGHTGIGAWPVTPGAFQTEHGDNNGINSDAFSASASLPAISCPPGC